MRKRAPIAIFLAACGGNGAAPPAASPAHASPAPPRVSEGALEARPLLGELPSKITHAGGGPLAIVASGTMSEGERLGAFVEVPKDACLVAYGRASPSLEDMDIAAFSEEGSPVALDEGPDPRPSILICPPHPERVYVAAHAAAGQGLAIVGAQLVPKDHAAEVGKLAGARGSVGATKTPEGWPGLEDLVRAHRLAIGGSWEEQRRVAVAVDARVVSAAGFSIDEGGCSDVFVVPDEDVALVDVDILDAEGRVLARARDGGSTRSVTICSPMATNGSVQVRPHIGRGLVAVVIARTKKDGARDLASRAEIAWVAPTQPLETTRAARTALLQKAGYGEATATVRGQLALGRRNTVPVTLGGGCTRIDVVAGAPLALVDAAVWDDAGALLGSAEGSDGAQLFACGKGKARVDLGTRGRPGPYAVLVRPESWKDPAFAAHPLAAGRMIARSAEGPASVYEGAAGSVRHVALESGRRYGQSEAIPADQCLRIAVGAEGEGSGIELRLVDTATNDELDRAHGQHDAVVRACAAKTPRAVQLSAGATAGKLEAIIGERFTSQAKP